MPCRRLRVARGGSRSPSVGAELADATWTALEGGGLVRVLQLGGHVKPALSPLAAVAVAARDPQDPPACPGCSGCLGHPRAPSAVTAITTQTGPVRDVPAPDPDVDGAPLRAGKPRRSRAAAPWADREGMGGREGRKERIGQITERTSPARRRARERSLAGVKGKATRPRPQAPALSPWDVRGLSSSVIDDLLDRLALPPSRVAGVAPNGLIAGSSGRRRAADDLPDG